jgi:TonB family protein
MTDAKDNSSLPLLLGISGTILVVAVGGWFFLEQGEPAPPSVQDAPIAAQPESGLAAIDDTTEPGEPETAVVEPGAAPAIEVVDAPTTGVDAELRKARLAADADILVVPAAQSALHYYGRILDVDPGHPIANAELDAMLARVAPTVTQHLEAEEFDQAYEIAALVARQRPEHALVMETQQTLDDYTEQLVEQAIQDVKDGNDEEAMLAITTAQGLPNRNPDYFTAVRESVAEIQDARQAAERDQKQRANNARSAWVQSVRDAIARGNLISPEGSSARDLMAEANNWSAERTQLSGELMVALIDTAESHIETELFDEAGALIDAASGFGDDTDELSGLRASLETAIIEKQSSSRVPLSKLVQTKTAPPEYPRRATRANLTGYVDLLFTVTPAGQTADIEVLRAEPEAVFDAAAIKAVTAWEFQPVEYRGQIISQRTAARLVFRIE